MSITARELDLLAARAWPPLEETRLGEWRLRFAGGVFKRSNSVLPLGPGPPVSLDKRTLDRQITAVEQAYVGRGLPPRFQITASSWPDAIADTLRARECTESDRTLVLTSSISTPESSGGLGERAIVERSEVSREWFETWWALDGRGGAAQAEIARAILDRIDAPCLFVECHEQEGIAAAALGVLDGAWVGLYCPATLPWARRRGCARAIVAHVLAAARQRGAVHAHLSVLGTNAPSRQLWSAFGFRAQQKYEYFTLNTHLMAKPPNPGGTESRIGRHRSHFEGTRPLPTS